MPIDYDALVEQNIPRKSALLERKSSGIDYDSLVDQYASEKDKKDRTSDSESSWYEATAIGAGKSVAPTAGGWAVGSAVGAATLNPILGLIAGLGTGIGLSLAQEKAIEAYDPALARKWSKIQEEHPAASTAGYFLGATPLTKVGTEGLKTLAKQLGTTPTKVATGAAGAGAALDVGMQAAGDQSYSLGSTVVSAIGTPLTLGGSGTARAMERAIEGKFAPKVTPKPGVTPPPEPKIETLDTDIAKWQEELSKEPPLEPLKTPLESIGEGEVIPTPQVVRKDTRTELEKELGLTQEELNRDPFKGRENVTHTSIDAREFDTPETATAVMKRQFEELAFQAQSALNEGDKVGYELAIKELVEFNKFYMDTLNSYSQTGVKELPTPQKGVETRPVTLEDTTPPKYLYHGTKTNTKYLLDKDGNLVLKPAKNFGGKTESVSFTHNKDFADDYAARVKGGGPEGFEFFSAKTIKIEADTLKDIRRESGEEWAINTDKPVVIPKGKFTIEDSPLQAQERMAWLENPDYTFDDWAKESTLDYEQVKANPKEYIRDYIDDAWGKEDRLKIIKKLNELKTAREQEITRLKDIVELRSTGKYKEPDVEWIIKPTQKGIEGPIDDAQLSGSPKILPEEPINVAGIKDEADFNLKGKEILRTQGPEAAKKFAQDYRESIKTPQQRALEQAQQYISENVDKHGTTLEGASDIIERSQNAILADVRLAEVYSREIETALPGVELREKMSHAGEPQKPWDKLLTDKEKAQEITKLQNKLQGLQNRIARTSDPQQLAELQGLEGRTKFVIDRLQKIGSEEAAIPMLRAIQTRLNAIGEKAKKAGLMESLRENYIPHMLDWTEFKGTAAQKQAILDKIFSAPKESKLVKDFTIHRKYEFLRDLEEVVAEWPGIKVQKDIAKVMLGYEKAMQTALIQDSMIKYLMNHNGPDGKPWIMKDSPEAKLLKYVSFEAKGSKPLQEYRVHPDLADSMGFMFRQSDPGVLVRGLGSVSHLTKALNTVGSLFHAKSLFEAGGLTSPSLMLKEIFTGGSGMRAAVKAFQSGDNPLIDLLIREGGLTAKVEDIHRTIVPQVGQFLDNIATQALQKPGLLAKGKDVNLVQRVTDPLDRHVLSHLNSFTWDYMHTGQKLNVAMHLFNKMKTKNPDMPDAQLAKEVSMYVNNTFGGINWLQIANQVHSKYLRALALKAGGIAGRDWAQIVMFAPDWTVSTLRAFTTALPKELAKPQNWKLREGIKGVYNPKTQGDLARRYVINTSLAWLTLINGINMAVSGKPIWENKDPTRVQFTDGTSMQAAKHSMEAVHWMMAPDKTLGNKLGFWPKALFVTTTGVAYPSPTAPKLKDTSAVGRAKAVALLGAPFQVSSAIQAPEGEGAKRAALSTVGLPVYGVSKETLKKHQKEGKAKVRQERLLKRIRGEQ